MKRITALALSLLGYASFAQSTQIGFETGVIASYSVNYFKDAQPVRFYKNWQKYFYDNSIFLRKQTENGWSFQINAAYHHDKYSGGYLNSLELNTLNYSLCIQHRLGEPGSKFEFYFGPSFTRLSSNGYYTFNIYSPKCSWNDNLIGFNCWANYWCNKNVAITFDLSTRVSLQNLNEDLEGSGASLNGYVPKFDKPNLYYTFMIGMSYKVDD